MKKVLILTVIAILALGVFALADTQNEVVSWGTTCDSTELVVHSTIGIEQGYVATATSYNASFCGATGNPLTDHYTNFTGNNANDVLLAKLDVSSNSSSIEVTVTTSTDPSTNTVLNDAISYSGGFSNGSQHTLSLTGGSNGTTPYQGVLYVYIPSPLPDWTAAGRYTLTTTFTISPANTY